MAEIDFGGMDAPEGVARGQVLSNAVHWAGGLVSLAMVGGLAVWGYDLMVRDVAGVPVIRALEGPMRVAPEEPGGTLAEHQGLAVNEVAGDGGTAGRVDRVVLAPPATGLTEEDLPLAELAVDTGDATDGADDALPAMAGEDEADLPVDSDDGPLGDDAGLMAQMDAAEKAAPVEDAPDDALATDLAVAEALAGMDETPDVLALADAISRGVEPLAMNAVATGADAELVAEPAVARFDDAAGVASTRRPVLRPARAVARRAAPAPEAAPVPARADIGGAVASADLAPGTRLVQLGAFASPEVAQEQWAVIGARFSEYFAGKRPVIQRADTNGKTFYRLRAAGFDDLADARRFCSALVSRSADCIPVVVR